MRLPRVDHGHGLGKQLMFVMIRLITGHRAPGVIRTHEYRPGLFGKAFGQLTQTVMRDSEAWSAGQCELFAGFVSKKNQCPF